MTVKNKPDVLVITGPTASGKTSLAVELALLLDGEVISADSMQIYKEMEIGTAKPDMSEMKGIPHHLIDFVQPGEDYSVARFLEDSKTAIEDILSRNKLPIVCGGSGLYISSLINNLAFFDVKRDDRLRAELSEIIKKEGISELIMELEKFDPESAERAKVHKNPAKIIRAIEVYRTSGMTISMQEKLSRQTPSPYNFICLALSFKDRQLLYSRINSRVDKMLEEGLLAEAARVHSMKLSTASQAIGHKELIPYIKGDILLNEAVEKLKMGTRRYAKRQLTWFRRDLKFKWFYSDEFENSRQMIFNIKEWVCKNLEKG